MRKSLILVGALIAVCGLSMASQAQKTQKTQKAQEAQEAPQPPEPARPPAPKKGATSVPQYIYSQLDIWPFVPFPPPELHPDRKCKVRYGESYWYDSGACFLTHTPNGTPNIRCIITCSTYKDVVMP